MICICPHCGCELEVPDEYAGRKGECGKCCGKFIVQQPSAAVRSPAPPPAPPPPPAKPPKTQSSLAIIICMFLFPGLCTFFGFIACIFNEKGNVLAICGKAREAKRAHTVATVIMCVSLVVTWMLMAIWGMWVKDILRMCGLRV